MRYGICKLSVVPMRKEKSHESELVSELLYNDIYEVSEDCQEWLKIKSLFDSYEGWIRSIQHSELDESEFNEILSKEKFIVNEAFLAHNNKILSFGSKTFENVNNTIPLRNQYDSKIMVESAIKLLDPLFLHPNALLFCLFFDIPVVPSRNAF